MWRAAPAGNVMSKIRYTDAHTPHEIDALTTTTWTVTMTTFHPDGSDHARFNRASSRIVDDRLSDGTP
jgi:hypothetical protein